MNSPDACGLLLIISGPSGVGKSTLTHRLEERLGGRFSISMTTRPRTAADTEGVDYFFVSREAFLAARDRGELLEWAEVFGHFYGTPRQPVVDALAAGELVLLEIDVQGALQVRKNHPQAMTLFVLPPSEKVLLERLRSRKREDEAVIQRRFAKARDEMALARSSGIYDHFLVNDDLEEAVNRAMEFIEARRRG